MPEELVAIVEQSLEPVFERIFHAAHYEERTLVVDLQDESAIADILGAVEAAHPEVYVKSRAKKMGPAVTLRITLSARGDDRAARRRPAAPAGRRAARQDRGGGVRHTARGERLTTRPLRERRLRRARGLGGAPREPE